MSVTWKEATAGLLAAVVGASAVLLAQGQGLVGGAAPQSRAAVEQVVRDYLLAHPEIIPQAMDKLQSNQTGQLITENRAAIEAPFAGAWTGNASGDVTLVEFSDYACGFCRASVADVDRLLAEDRKLKLVVRELPILSPQSDTAAKVSLVAAKQGRFYGFHKAIYAAGPLGPASIEATAARVGLANVPSQAGASDIENEIAANIALARVLHLSGTPSFVVGDKVLVGAVGYDALKQAIADARAQKHG